MEKEFESYPLTGKWDWLNISVLFEKRWQPVKTLEASDHVWFFRENGIMESESFGKPCYCVRYEWHIPGMVLSLDGYDLDPEGNRHMIVYEKYEVCFLNRDELFLYDIEDFMDMPGCRLRLYFKRSGSRYVNE